MDIVAQMEEFGRRLARVAEAGGRSPNEFLSSGIAGWSRSGRVSVTVNTMGHLESVRIEPGSVLPDDEANLAAAIMEAYADARTRTTAMLTELIDVESTPTQIPRRIRPPRQQDEDDYSSGAFMRNA
jgi:DNA-binding protein YbaB